ncbi:MAG: hypothetical protein U1E05_05760 [Patescibacteria group bacterium]|nr:hypothetical protein [Patescibacteria group bacterium]
MYFLFSGEGATDLGSCRDGASQCEGNEYRHGPMAIIVARIVEQRHRYSLLDGTHYGYVSERALEDRAATFKANGKKLRLPVAKTPRETRYFFNNARALARIASEREHHLQDQVVAILFRDSDGTASAGRGLWEDKRLSMINGFAQEEFPRGVPMIPKPKSEAWLLCALKPNPYQGCNALEQRSGNDRSPNSLKAELAEGLGEPASREMLNSLLADGTIDIHRIRMPSFDAFRSDLEQAI